MNPFLTIAIFLVIFALTMVAIFWRRSSSLEAKELWPHENLHPKVEPWDSATMLDSDAHEFVEDRFDLFMMDHPDLFSDGDD